MLSETLEQRLGWFEKDYCTASDSVIVVQEKEASGQATLRCRTTSYAVAFNLHRKPLSSLKNQRCADGIILSRVDPDRWHLHVIELKTTMTPSEWKKVRLQFEGAILNGLALAGVLGIPEIAGVTCYSAFRHNGIDVNSTLYKAALGGPVTSTVPLDWRKGRLELLSLKDVPHHRIELDKTSGEGELQL